jgi:hypothetical protein
MLLIVAPLVTGCPREKDTLAATGPSGATRWGALISGAREATAVIESPLLSASGAEITFDGLTDRFAPGETNFFAPGLPATSVDTRWTSAKDRYTATFDAPVRLQIHFWIAAVPPMVGPPGSELCATDLLLPGTTDDAGRQYLCARMTEWMADLSRLMERESLGVRLSEKQPAVLHDVRTAQGIGSATACESAGTAINAISAAGPEWAACERLDRLDVLVVDALANQRLAGLSCPAVPVVRTGLATPCTWDLGSAWPHRRRLLMVEGNAGAATLAHEFGHAMALKHYPPVGDCSASGAGPNLMCGNLAWADMSLWEGQAFRAVQRPTSAMRSQWAATLALPARDCDENTSPGGVCPSLDAEVSGVEPPGVPP